MTAVMQSRENDRSEWSRYQIRIIMDADCQTLGAVVAAAENKSKAKTEAQRLGTDYYHGVAIVDIEDGVVDAGECEGSPLIFDLNDLRLED